MSAGQRRYDRDEQMRYDREFALIAITARWEVVREEIHRIHRSLKPVIDALQIAMARPAYPSMSDPDLSQVSESRPEAPTPPQEAE